MPELMAGNLPKIKSKAVTKQWHEAVAEALARRDAAPPTQDVAPTQLVPPTQDMECAPTQLVPPSQACDLPDESALEFNSQPSQLTADDEEAEFQF